MIRHSFSAALFLFASLPALSQDGPPPPRGPGGPMMQERKILKQFDTDGDGRLNKEERQAAREFLKKDRPQGGRRFGPPRENREPPQPGPKVTPEEVKSYPDSNLYEPTVLRTFFFEFEDAD
jgi:hypothetical protein